MLTLKRTSLIRKSLSNCWLPLKSTESSACSPICKRKTRMGKSSSSFTFCSRGLSKKTRVSLRSKRTLKGKRRNQGFETLISIGAETTNENFQCSLLKMDKATRKAQSERQDFRSCNLLLKIGISFWWTRFHKFNRQNRITCSNRWFRDLR